MKKTNKLIAILICMAMIFSMCSLIGYAFEVEEDFNIQNYTWNDIMTMSNSEFRELLTNFERVYDPFGTYETEPLTAIYEEDIATETVQPMWESGEIDENGNIVDTGSHELITARACGILLDDKGFWGNNESGSILIALSLSLASIFPDTQSELGVSQLFRGHFYDPDTGENWAGETSNTAKTNAKLYYNAAYGCYSLNSVDEDFIMNVGMMLHYVKDVCVPHHAANVTFVNVAHGAFEDYADDNLDSYIESLTTISDTVYTTGTNKNIEEIVHDAAVVAKQDISYVNNIFSQSNWNTVANRTTRAAVVNSAIVLYKLSLELDIPLTQ